MRRAFACAVVTVVAVVLAAIGCNSQGNIGFLGSSDAGLRLFEAGPELHCSEDMRDRVDDDGRIVSTCPDGKACVEGRCVDVCEAAATTQGSVGCDFLVPTPFFAFDNYQPCFAAFIANTWAHPAAVTLSWNGKSFDPSTFGRIAEIGVDPANWKPIPPDGVPEGKVAILFLSDDAESGPLAACPIEPAVRRPGSSGEWPLFSLPVGKRDSFHIQTDMPVSAYDIYPYSAVHYGYDLDDNRPSAQLLLPTSAWGTSYVSVVAPRIPDYLLPQLGDPFVVMPLAKQFGQVVALTDNTSVTITPDVPNGVLNDHPLSTFTLNAGEVMQFASDTELSGRVISADQPIAYVGGQACLLLDSWLADPVAGVPWGTCDTTHQMIPPVPALGLEYAIAPFKTRLVSGKPESVNYRLLGAAPSTALQYDPPIPGAPTTLEVGTVADFETTEPFVVQSQDGDHPFYIGQMMKGCLSLRDNPHFTSPCIGDEEWINVIPPAQYLKKYIFFTDPSYPTTNLVLLRSKVDDHFSDVTVDCVGTVANWKPVGTSGQYEMTDVDLVRDGVPNGTCANGRHVAQSDGPFGLVAWGLGQFVSYAYPAGGSARPINLVVTPPVPK